MGAWHGSLCCTHTHPYTHTHTLTRSYTHTGQGWLPPPVCAALGCVGHAWVASPLGPGPLPPHWEAGQFCRPREAACRRGFRAVLGAWFGRGLLLRPAVVSWIRYAQAHRMTWRRPARARPAPAPAARGRGAIRGPPHSPAAAMRGRGHGACQEAAIHTPSAPCTVTRLAAAALRGAVSEGTQRRVVGHPTLGRTVRPATHAGRWL